MYTNTGEQILGIAKIMLVIGIIISIILGFLIGTMVPALTYNENASVAAFFIGVIVAAIGCLSSYLSYLLLAGFGELIENTYKTHCSVEKLRNGYKKTKPEDEEASGDNEYAKKLNLILNQFLEGKINEYELNERSAKLNEIYGEQE